MKNNKIILTDNYKKESWLPILSFIASLMTSLIILITTILKLNRYYVFPLEKNQLIIIFTIFGMLTLFAFYYLLETLFYKLEVTENKIYTRTLFKKIEYNFKGSEICRYKRHRNSSLYQFSLRSETGGILVTTRYKEEFLKILEKHNITTNEIGKGDKL